MTMTRIDDAAEWIWARQIKGTDGGQNALFCQVTVRLSNRISQVDSLPRECLLSNPRPRKLQETSFEMLRGWVAADSWPSGCLSLNPRPRRLSASCFLRLRWEVKPDPWPTKRMFVPTPRESQRLSAEMSQKKEDLRTRCDSEPRRRYRFRNSTPAVDLREDGSWRCKRVKRRGERGNEEVNAKEGEEKKHRRT